MTNTPTVTNEEVHAGVDGHTVVISWLYDVALEKMPQYFSMFVLHLGNKMFIVRKV